MADVTTESAKWQYTFNLTRDGEKTTRVFSIDNPLSEVAGGVSAAKAFRDVFTGAASSPFSVIDPTQFIQPTGWRDENPDELPWTTTAVYLKRIETTETAYGGGGGGGGDEAVIGLSYDSEIEAVTITYQGTSTPQVYKADGTTVSIRAGNPGYWFIENVTSGETYFVFTAPDATLAAGAATITIP